MGEAKSRLHQSVTGAYSGEIPNGLQRKEETKASDASVSQYHREVEETTRKQRAQVPVPVVVEKPVVTAEEIFYGPELPSDFSWEKACAYRTATGSSESYYALSHEVDQQLQHVQEIEKEKEKGFTAPPMPSISAKPVAAVAPSVDYQPVIAEAHVLPTGYNFEKVQHDFEKVQHAKEEDKDKVFTASPMPSISTKPVAAVAPSVAYQSVITETPVHSGFAGYDLEKIQHGREEKERVFTASPMPSISTKPVAAVAPSVAYQSAIAETPVHSGSTGYDLEKIQHAKEEEKETVFTPPFIPLISDKLAATITPSVDSQQTIGETHVYYGPDLPTGYDFEHIQNAKEEERQRAITAEKERLQYQQLQSAPIMDDKQYDSRVEESKSEKTEERQKSLVAEKERLQYTSQAEEKKDIAEEESKERQQISENHAQDHIQAAEQRTEGPEKQELSGRGTLRWTFLKDKFVRGGAKESSSAKAEGSKSAWGIIGLKGKEPKAKEPKAEEPKVEESKAQETTYKLESASVVSSVTGKYLDLCEVNCSWNVNAQSVVNEAPEVVYGPSLPDNFTFQPRPYLSHQSSSTTTTTTVSSSAYGTPDEGEVTPTPTPRVYPVIDDSSFASSKPLAEHSVFDYMDDRFPTPPPVVKSAEQQKEEDDAAFRAITTISAEAAGFDQETLREVLNSQGGSSTEKPSTRKRQESQGQYEIRRKPLQEHVSVSLLTSVTDTEESKMHQHGNENHYDSHTSNHTASDSTTASGQFATSAAEEVERQYVSVPTSAYESRESMERQESQSQYEIRTKSLREHVSVSMLTSFRYRRE